MQDKVLKWESRKPRACSGKLSACTELSTEAARGYGVGWGIPVDVHLLAVILIRKLSQVLFTSVPHSWMQNIKGYNCRNKPSNLCFIFDKGAKTIQLEKASLISKRCWDYYISMCKRMKLVCPLSHTIYKINPQWTRELNIRAKPIRFLEENIGVNINLSNLRFGNSFLNTPPKA